MVLEDMPDHEDSFPGCGERDEFFAFFVGKSNGLFDKDVFIGKERFFDHGIMGGCRCGYGDGLDVWVGEQFGIVAETGNIRVFFLYGLKPFLVIVADGVEGIDLVEIPDKIFSPVAAANDGDVFFHPSYISPMIIFLFFGLITKKIYRLPPLELFILYSLFDFNC